MSIVRSHSGAIAGFFEDFKALVLGIRRSGRPEKGAGRQTETNSTDRPVSKSHPRARVKYWAYFGPEKPLLCNTLPATALVVLNGRVAIPEGGDSPATILCPDEDVRPTS